MAAGSVCWLHDDDNVHVAATPVGVVRDRGDVIPADLRCANREVRDGSLDADQVVDALQVTIGWVRS